MDVDKAEQQVATTGEDDPMKGTETIDASSTATPKPSSSLLITGPGEPSNPNPDATLAEQHGVDIGSTEPMSELETDLNKKRATELTEDDLDHIHNKTFSSPITDSC